MNYLSKIISIVVFYVLAITILSLQSCGQSRPHTKLSQCEFKLWEYNNPASALLDCKYAFDKLDKQYDQYVVNRIEEVDDGYTLYITQEYKGRHTDLEVYFYDIEDDEHIEIYLDSMFKSRG